MSRDLDPRSLDFERPDPTRGGRVSSDPRDPAVPDPRDVFTQGLDLPRGTTRERVHVNEHTYELRGSESRSLATIGAFRVIQARDLSEHDGRSSDVRTGDLRHLREAGLIRTVGVHGFGGARTTLVTLTERARELLEARRLPIEEPRQVFYAGLAKRPELGHDMQLYRAYLRAAERLHSQGGRIRRVVLDYELKRDYQRVRNRPSRTRNRDTEDSVTGSPDIHAWAHAHQLPVDDGHVQFPDVRIEYEDRHGRPAIEDLEVVTPHYRGKHAAAKSRSGFTRYRTTGTRVGGLKSGRSGGRPFDPRFAEELLP